MQRFYPSDCFQSLPSAKCLDLSTVFRVEHSLIGLVIKIIIRRPTIHRLKLSKKMRVSLPEEPEETTWVPEELLVLNVILEGLPRLDVSSAGPLLATGVFPNGHQIAFSKTTIKYDYANEERLQ
jgi:hypothetical protein